MIKFICTSCNKEYPTDTLEYQCVCGGMFKLDFKPANFSLAQVETDRWNIYRYKEFMPFTTDTWKQACLGEGMTPIVSYDEYLLMKVDYLNPTLSFKDRGASTLLSHCKDIGVTSVVQDSSGNAGNSVAAYSARLGISCEIFVPESTSHQKIAMIKSHGAKVHIIAGDRDHCANACRDYVQETRKYYANHVYNPYFYEGTKTYIYEVYEQLKYLPDNIFIPLGNGTLFIGSILALEHLKESSIIETMPNIIAVQSEKCAPFAAARSKRLNRIPKITPERTLAEGIAIGKPMRDKQILEYIYKYNIDIVTIPEAAIIPARNILARSGFYVEHTTAGNLAAYTQYRQKHALHGKSLITLCGAPESCNFSVFLVL